ncbi:MAG: hypothetical protein IPF99_41620 [Deltaproteobacteria bacterium]|nr:hypothetical protein [Deltaproteobacteria bacterium]
MTESCSSRRSIDPVSWSTRSRSWVTVLSFSARALLQMRRRRSEAWA